MEGVERRGKGEGITGTADGRLRKLPQPPPFFDASIRIWELNVQRRDDEKGASPSCRSQKWRMGSAAEERVTMKRTAQRSSREFSSTRATLNSMSSEMASRFRCNLNGSRMGEGSSDDENAFSCSILTFNASTFSACLQPLCALSVSVRGRLWLTLRKNHACGDFFSSPACNSPKLVYSMCVAQRKQGK